MLHPLSVLALALVALVPIPHRPGATVQVLPLVHIRRSALRVMTASPSR